MIFTPDTYKKFLELCGKFNNFHWKNVMLIFSQNPDARKIATSKAWQQQYNRKVLPGAKTIGILVPSVMNDNISFKSANVYDISVTVGSDLPSAVKYDYKALIGCIREISDSSLVFGTTNYSKGISVEDNLTDEETVEELFSALTNDDNVSYILCKYFGLDTSAYSFEITELSDDALKEIHQTASELIHKIEWAYQNRLDIKGLCQYFSFEEIMIINYCLEEDDRYEFIQKMVKIHDNSDNEDIRDIIWNLISKIEVLSDIQYEKLREDKFNYKLSAFGNYIIE